MAEWCATNLRGVAAWRDEGLHFSTTSDEATKNFDGLLRQLVSWSDCEQLGGLGKTAENMLLADPEAIMTRSFKYVLELMGTGTSSLVNDCLEKKILQLEPYRRDECSHVVAKKEKSFQKDAAVRGTDWEKAHVKATKQWGYGHFADAAATWEEILQDHPTDLLALKMAHEAYFFMGDCKNKRDSIRRVMPFWRRDMPCYSYLHGMLAFGLEECGQYWEAEKEALTALSMNRYDCWATHAKAHVLEMNGRYNEGIVFLQDTMDDWMPGWIIATHNFWHKAVFHIEKAEYEEAVSIYDLEVSRRAAKRSAVLDMVDATALLLRLEMEGVNVGDRWKRLPDISHHWQDHVTAFNDAHMAPLFISRGDYEVERKMHDSLVNFTKSGVNDTAKVNQIVGLGLYEGMVDYMNEKYDQASEKMLAIRHDVYRIGGSHAQRDVFTQALIHSCSLSEKEEHWRMTPTILEERASIRTGITEHVAYEELFCVEGQQFTTAFDAAKELGLIQSDDHFDEAMREAAFFRMPHALRDTFATLLAFDEPTNVDELWDKWKGEMSEDFVHRGRTPQDAEVLAYYDILEMFPPFGNLITVQYDRLAPMDDDNVDHQALAQEMLNKLTRKQHEAVSAAFSEQENLIFIDGPGGTGKTFCYETAYHALKCNNKKVVCCAWSGIAANLLPEGRTVSSS